MTLVPASPDNSDNDICLCPPNPDAVPHVLQPHVAWQQWQQQPFPCPPAPVAVMMATVLPSLTSPSPIAQI